MGPSLDSHFSSIPPLNGSPHDNNPQSAPPEYRRGPFLSPDHHVNGDPPPYSAPPAHFAAHPSQPPSLDYYANQPIARNQRRPTRAQQACDQCRARKAKCDEGRPYCTHCKENNLDCVYRDNPPHRHEKSTQLVLDRLDQVQNTLDLIVQRNHDEHETIHTATNRTHGKLDAIQAAALDRTDRTDDMLRLQTDLGLKFEKLMLGETSKKENPRPSQVKTENSSFEQQQQGGDMLMADPADPPAPSQPEKEGEDWLHTIPVEHTTAAHKLLGWRWIKHVLSSDMYDEEYVMQLEENRGLIRVYGRGEDHDASEDPEPAHFHSDAAAPMPDYDEKVPGIEPLGFMTTGSATVRRYYQSYLDHMHRLHPFLYQGDLDANMAVFIDAYCPKDSVSPAVMMDSNPSGRPQGSKRKRQDPPYCPPRRVQRTVHNAIILLVLAVGSICDRRETPLAFLESPTDRSQPNSFSTLDGQGSFSTTSTFRSGAGRPRNLDVIPGMAYYAYATDIIGNLQGAVRLPHAQAALLAAIYAGQLAHPFQSHAWIAHAARACRVLLRPKRYDLLVDGKEKDLYLFNYWTCFQLESDILAELDLPDSGISRMESRMALPTGRYTLNTPGIPGEVDPQNYTMMFLYSAQIHLRKILNRVHTDLYTATKQETEGKNLHEILNLTLTQWRATLPEDLRWNDHDPPSEDINIARLRAKFYGARYIIHRPVLYYYLEMFPPSSEADPSPAPLDSQMADYIYQRGPSASGEEGAFGKLPQDKQKACKACINSAIQSTRAFDGVKGGRPVVTNIFGTGHAQFGNMLVLSATYVSPFGDLVNRGDLDRLLIRTITFLEKSHSISPTLRKDAEILRRIYFRIFQTEPAIFSS
ncbi:C6 finger domain protein [Aspergillus sp. HF37]|nr:C6 finger domain protein [Aspergillus sp. HF37]